MRAFAAVWGGWLIVTGLVFSYMQGIIHPYYMVALGPAIGALVGVGAISLWQARMGWAGRVTSAVAVLVTAWWSHELLDRSPDWLPWLRFAVVAAGVVAAVALVVAGLPGFAAARARFAGTAAGVTTGAALIAGLGGPFACTLYTVGTTYTGSLPSAGPAVAGAFGGAFGGPGGRFGGRGGFPGGAVYDLTKPSS
jgi:4-amino-4-deoxy-L-arabinose transferase-like glycosyltransferase